MCHAHAQVQAMRVRTTNEDVVGKRWLLRFSKGAGGNTQSMPADQGSIISGDPLRTRVLLPDSTAMQQESTGWLAGVAVDDIILHQWTGQGNQRVLAPTLTYLKLTQDFHESRYHKRWRFERV